MPTNLRYLASPSARGDLLDLRTKGAAYAVNGYHIDYRLDGEIEVVGNSAANSVWVAPGASLSAQQLLGGEDRIFFTGTWADYSKTLDTAKGTITFSRWVDGQIERVTVGNGQIGLTRDLLVFADGAVRTDTVRKTLTEKGLSASTEDLKAEGALTTATADDWNTQATSVNPGALSPDAPGGSVRGLARSGGSFALPTAGVDQVLTGAAGVDYVYVTPGATVDARQLLGGEDRIFLTGSWADYHKVLDNRVGALIFTREVDGRTEQVTVGNGQIALSQDLLVFADGAVRTDTVRKTLTDKGLSATVEDLKAQGSLTSTNADNWLSDTFTKGGDAVVIAPVSYNDYVDAYEKNFNVDVSGRAAAGSSVELEWAGTRKSITADANGDWSTHFSSGEVPNDGKYTLKATATDQDGKVSIGNRTVVVDTLAPERLVLDPVTGDNRITPAEQAAGLTLTGRAEAGSLVTVIWGNKWYTGEHADDTGKWSVALASRHTLEGNGTLSLKLRDQAGNESIWDYQVQEDTSAPGTLILSPPPMDSMVISA